jgi:hypothetical protein
MGSSSFHSSELERMCTFQSLEGQVGLRASKRVFPPEGPEKLDTEADRPVGT